MVTLDYVVLVAYFGVMILIGVYSSLKIKAQEDFFMGGRSFGKLLQTFAAFGAGTGSSDPVNTGRTTFTSGMSGMWSVMSWLFVTPFYWITGVWYRRMRHLTLGDWFVERYESQAMGAAYCVFGLLFFMVYGSMMFSAIGKVTAPLIAANTFELAGNTYPIEYLLVPIIGVVVLFYGIAGGLRAAYFTDLIQGICIILLSVLLIPYGLSALVAKFGDPSQHGLWDGFRLMHQQLAPENFQIVGSGASEFPVHRIVAVAIISLVGIVVQPHFIATGGGSAKTETNARVGLVTGNFLKRFCTVGWVLTALIALALYSDLPELIVDPDKAWGVASRELLGPGLTGLMLACLLAALMSSVDAYMIVGSGLVVRNIYAPYFDPRASEREYVLVARLTGGLVVAGAVLISLFYMDVFEQLQLTWVFPVLFAAPFWIGMYWRRATTAAAWLTVAYCAAMFFLIPWLAPQLLPDLRTNPSFTKTNHVVTTITTRLASPTDVDRRRAEIQLWDERAAEIEQAGETSELEQLGSRPTPIGRGDLIPIKRDSGGQFIFWDRGSKPEQKRVLKSVLRSGDLELVIEAPDTDEEQVFLFNLRDDPRRRTNLAAEMGQQVDQLREKLNGGGEALDREGDSLVLTQQYDGELAGAGNFKLDFLLYDWAGMNLTGLSGATLDTLELPPKIITPFLVMIVLSLITPRNSKQTLDRYYAKMKTPVDPNPERDHENLEKAYANPAQFEQQKLLPGSSLEFSKPTTTDVLGFVICFVVCFAIIGAAAWVGGLGG